MKTYVYLFAFLFVGYAMAQEKPKEVKEKVETKTVKVNDGEKTTEKKVKVITRETTSVKLDEKDKNEVNQDRVNSISKVEKLIMVDNDVDGDYDFLTKETFYKIGDKNYLFKPNKRGFNIAFNNNKSKFEPVESALSTSKNGHYLVNGETYAGIGYFNSNNDFVIEYYDKDTDGIKTKTYLLATPK
tara:strand:- start:1575 stop:2132 length:558 start_codon:yes stop_codon:yes gene_type:complete